MFAAYRINDFDYLFLLRLQSVFVDFSAVTEYISHGYDKCFFISFLSSIKNFLNSFFRGVFDFDKMTVYSDGWNHILLICM